MAAVAGGGCVAADGVVEALAPAPAAPVPVPNYVTQQKMYCKPVIVVPVIITCKV